MRKMLQVLAVGLCLMLLASCGRTKSDSTPDTIRIGVLACLTGPAAEYGKQLLDGAKMAAADFEKDNNRHVELVVQDTKSTPKDAVAAFQQLTDINGLKFVIGDVLSGSVMAIAPVANQKGVLVFAPGASTPALDDLDDMIFRNWISDSYDAKIIADYCNSKGFQKVAVLFVNNEYGNSLAKRFTQFLKDADKRTVLSTSFADDQTNFQDIIDRLFAAKPEAVYVIGYSKSIGLLARQIKEKRGTGAFQLLSNFTASEPQALEIAGDALNGLVFTDPNQAPPAAWNARYREKTGNVPGVVSAHAYDATLLLLSSISHENGKPNPESVKKHLASIKDYPGISGKTSFSDTGDAFKPVFLKRMQVTPEGVASSVVITEIAP